MISGISIKHNPKDLYQATEEALVVDLLCESNDYGNIDPKIDMLPN